MNATQVEAARAIMRQRGISESQANEVLMLVAGELAKAEHTAKAERQGMTLAELQAFDLGKSIVQRTARTVRKTGSAGLTGTESEQFAAGREAMRKFQGNGGDQ